MREQIIKALYETFPDCSVKFMDNLIYVRRGNHLVTDKPIDYNTLIYYFETNQLNNYLKELK